MRLKLNGEAREVPEHTTLMALLSSLGLRAEQVAVEHNRTIVHRRQFASIRLRDGDELEIVRIVGGG
ncbi:MAG: sulfur carrier protein ThiS [Acidobacteriota bacterium]